jgi:hypothetical protein
LYMKNFKFKGISVYLLVTLFFSFLPFSASAADLLLDWAKPLNSAANSYIYGITSDSSGNSYVAGYFLGTTDFDPGAGTVEFTSAGTEDVFVAKYDIDGGLVWAKQIGGVGDDDAYSIAYDSLGGIYVSGYFTGAVDFNPGVGVNTLTATGDYDSFILKLDTDGNFVWAKQTAVAVGSSSNTTYVQVDASHNVYATGRFSGTTSDVFGTELTSAGSHDIFISKFEPDGDLIWIKQFGSTGSDVASTINADTTGFIYTAGYFTGTVSFGATDLTAIGGRDLFIAKLDSDGNFVWAKRMGSTSNDTGYVSSLSDPDGNIFLAGYFTGTADFGVTSLVSAGSIDVFTTKLDSDGNFLWAKKIGGTGAEYGTSVSVDSLGNVFTLGTFEGTVDFDSGTGTHELTSVATADSFILESDPDGNFVWAGQIGGHPAGGNIYIYVDSSDTLHVGGYFAGTADFDPGTGTIPLISTGGDNAFVARYYFEDIIPAAFTFVDQTDVALGTVIESNEITISGINAATPISISSCTGTACEYSINSGVYTSVSGTVENGDTVKVHQTASGSGGVETNLTLNIGGITDVFSVTTVAPPVVHHSSSGSYAPGFGPARNTITNTTPATPVTPKFTFTKNLKYLQIDNEVKELQKFLNAHNYLVATTGAGSSGLETTKFGSLTKKALIKFQLANSLVGDGLVGPKTRAVLNK